MPIIAIHIGIPRTGTTTIQKNILNLSKNHIAIQKNPYGSSGNSKKANKQTKADNIDICKLLDSLEGRSYLQRSHNAASSKTGGRPKQKSFQKSTCFSSNSTGSQN